MATLTNRLKHAWNAFSGRDNQAPETPIGSTVSYGTYRPDRYRLRIANERSIVSSVYTRLSIDVSAQPIRHVRVDDNGRYQEDMPSGLNYCLTMEPNLDQGPRQFMQDVALTMFDEGVIAIVPVETSINPDLTGGYDIRNLRVGRIVDWYPEHVRVNLYNERLGKREDIVLGKRQVAIVENPLYSVMNEPNSTLQRLITKLNMLDQVDAQSSSGKLDLIIQLPYTIKSEARRAQAQQRREDIEFQLKGSQYGIAYADATEKITQLNRPAENNLLTQVEYLTELLYSQLGLTAEVMNGTADEKAMLNYMNRTVEPILDAVVQAMRRSFLTKTAQSQGQTIMMFSNPFRLVPINDMAEIADKFTRNEILTSNEIRQILGIKPANDPKADELRNSNMPAQAEPETLAEPEGEDEALQSELDSIEADIDATLADFGG